MWWIHNRIKNNAKGYKLIDPRRKWMLFLLKNKVLDKSQGNTRQYLSKLLNHMQEQYLKVWGGGKCTLHATHLEQSQHTANAQAVMTPALNRSCIKIQSEKLSKLTLQERAKTMNCTISHANHVTTRRAFKIQF